MKILFSVFRGRTVFHTSETKMTRDQQVKREM